MTSEIAEYRNAVDRDRHRARKSKSPSSFPHAGAKDTVTRIAPAKNRNYPQPVKHLKPMALAIHSSRYRARTLCGKSNAAAMMSTFASHEVQDVDKAFMLALPWAMLRPGLDDGTASPRATVR